MLIAIKRIYSAVTDAYEHHSVLGIMKYAAVRHATRCMPFINHPPGAVIADYIYSLAPLTEFMRCSNTSYINSSTW